MRRFFALALLAASLNPALAQTSGVPYHSGSTTLRAGTTCTLNVIGRTHVDYRGLCNVAREGRTTVVDTGDNRYAIIRDPFNNTRANVYDLTGDQNRFLDEATAMGNCWSGEHFEFCAL